jgi:hypothetical protein
VVAVAGRENLLTAVSSPCTVLIAAPELLPILQKRAAATAGELLSFTDADALRALAVITKRRPGVVALERLFAATPRGAALINRIKADPSLVGSEIRIVSHDTDYTRVSPRRPVEGGASPAVGVVDAPAEALPASADFRSTRRAPRFRIAGTVDAVLDGSQASLVDLSVIGAQVMSAVVLKPNQRVRMVLQDGTGAIRVNASVAWASFEIAPKSGARYRAGLEFIDADAAALQAYCSRHKL